MLWYILFVVGLVYIYQRFINLQFYWRNKNVTHVKPWPLIGNMGPFIFGSISFPELIQDMYNKYSGRYFGFYKFSQPTLMLKDPGLIKQITIKEFDSFLNHKEFLSGKMKPEIEQYCLSALKEHKWRETRSTLSPAFTGSKMRSMYSLIAESAEEFTNHFSIQKTKLDVEMKDVFSRFANDVIATTAFGIKCDSMKNKTNEFYMKSQEATNFNKFNLKSFGYSISPLLKNLFSSTISNEDTCEFFKNLVKNTILSREEKGIVRPDMINMLMEAKNGKINQIRQGQTVEVRFATVEKTPINNQQNTLESEDRDLVPKATLFYFAGFNTISSNMCLLAHELALNPDIQLKLQVEIDNAFEKDNGKISYETISKMKYLDMVVSEGLRKWPTAVVTDRICNKSFVIEPVGNEEPLHLNKGDICYIPIFAIHRDAQYYPDPEKFDPERFSDENKDKINPLTYIPFGSGPRACIGSRFALLQIKTVMAHLLRKFTFTPNEKTTVPLQMSKDNYNLTPEGGFQLSLKPRDNY